MKAEVLIRIYALESQPMIELSVTRLASLALVLLFRLDALAILPHNLLFILVF